MNLLKILGGDFVGKIIDKVAPDKISQEERMKLNQAFELQVMANESKVEEYRRDMIVADSKSEDSYVSRARPTLFYIFYFVIIFNYILVPLLQIFKGNHLLVPLQLPSELWNMFTAGYLGYSGFRTFDKHSKNKHCK
ncbi:MAG: hypothetical protein COB02_12260 [Candidatus Cloacimonadota bacterium]|nr:MAG: hypothetical protein COB02_12260 [Candidatus Cloacimonadota bacterium]